MEGLQQELQGMVDGDIAVEDEETVEQVQTSLVESEAKEENADEEDEGCQGWTETWHTQKTGDENEEETTEEPDDVNEEEADEPDQEAEEEEVGNPTVNPTNPQGPLALLNWQQFDATELRTEIRRANESSASTAEILIFNFTST